jgi:acyl-CoA reductase-like NAD-dependent aldehyde dehydrogenase
VPSLVRDEPTTRAVFPFGGFTWSGVGRETGVGGLELYTELQTYRILR